MPLTPAEVHNVAFKKPPIGKRGYDEEEVDAFLDIVEVELSRPLEENNELKTHSNGNNGSNGVATGGANPAELAAARDDNARLQNRIGELERALNQGKDGASQQLVQVQQQLAATQEAHNQTRQQLEQAQQVAAQAQEAARTAAQQAAQATQAAQAQSAQAQTPAAASPEQHAQAIQVLAMAQQTAEQHLSQSRTEAERVLAEARQSADSHLSEAQGRATTHLNEAQARADHLDRESTTRANALIADAETRAATITTQLEQRKDALERRVEQLRTFEREYRTRLKSYLESQLRDLDASGRSDPAASGGQNEHAAQQEQPQPVQS
jgi:DivIVA domain-containing protein